jgi:hypothetical protein
MSALASHAERTAKFKQFLEREHFRFRRQPDAAAAEGEVELTASWRLRLGASCTPLLERMEGDFRRFCKESMEVTLGGDGSGPEIVWSLSETPLPHAGFDRTDPEVEAFELAVSEARVEIRARHERGLLHGTHYLEWLMADRGGPFLPIGKTEHRPAFMPRLSNGVFIDGHQTPENPGDFPDDYLALMSHYGANGVHLNLMLWEIFHSPTLPELNAPGFTGKIAALRKFAQRLATFGIDLYLQINTPPLTEDHPVFLAHPEARGARVEIFIEELSGKPWNNLCSGSETVLRAYSEAVENIFNAAPELAGGIIIIGGEAFYQCFTRPANAGNGETNCPCCNGRSPSREIARLSNTIAHAIKKTGAHKISFAWPYSAFIWSSADPAQLEWIGHLDPEVSVLTNFDCGDEDKSTRGGAHYFDYNIKCTGPSTTFARQAERRHAQGRRIFTKIETNTTPDAFFLPYLPLHYRWLKRVRAMRETGVSGFVGQWRFFGMNATPPEELQYKAVWRNSEDCDWEDQTLLNLCKRDFGLQGNAATPVLAGWKLLSEAWDFFPYSAMLSGERAAYMRGPLYLGPSHPLIFDVQDTYNLPADFRLLRGDAIEMANTEEERIEMQRRAKPRYVSDLLLTLPFGTERFLELLTECRARWSKGMDLLRQALSGGTERAQMELDLCEALGRHLETVENVVLFYRERDRLHLEPCDTASFRKRLATLQQILDNEIANAEAMLLLVERDPRIGYGHCYGPIYDEAMIRAKIAQCHQVRDVELPRFSQVVRFHVWLDSP